MHHRSNPKEIPLSISKIKSLADNGYTDAQIATILKVSPGVITRRLDNLGYVRKDKHGFTIDESRQRVTIPSLELRRVLERTNSIPKTAEHFNTSTATIRNRMAYYGIPAPKGATRGRQSIDIPKSQLESVLKAQGFNIQKAADVLGVSTTLVRSRMAQLSIEKPDPCEKESFDLEAAEIAYRSGVPLSVIAQQYGESSSFIRKCLDSVNVPIRLQGKPTKDSNYNRYLAQKKKYITLTREITDLGERAELLNQISVNENIKNPARDYLTIEVLYVGCKLTPQKIAKKLGVTPAQINESLDFIRTHINPRIDEDRAMTFAQLNARQNAASAMAESSMFDLSRVVSFSSGYIVADVLDRALASKNPKYANASSGTRAAITLVSTFTASAAAYSFTQSKHAISFAGGALAQAVISNYIVKKLLP